MITTIGSIKVDESRPERVKYYYASLCSLIDWPEIVGNYIVLNLEQSSDELKRETRRIFERKLGSLFANRLIIHDYDTSIKNDYGKNYIDLINEYSHYGDYILNFQEDHFLDCDLKYLTEILWLARRNGIDVIRATFNEIEKKCILNTKLSLPMDYKVKPRNPSELELLISWMDRENFAKFQEPYGKRFWMGNNSIMSVRFAKEYYNKPGTNPREYEQEYYPEDQVRPEYMLGVPKNRILAAIDDPHGEPGSNLLSKPSLKFSRIWESINL